MLAEDALESEAIPLGGAARSGVERVALPLVAAIAERLENVASEQELGLGRERRPLQRRAVENVADLDDPHRRADLHQRENAERAPAFAVDDGVRERVRKRRTLLHPGCESRFVREGAVAH